MAVSIELKWTVFNGLIHLSVTANNIVEAFFDHIIQSAILFHQAYVILVLGHTELTYLSQTHKKVNNIVIERWVNMWYSSKCRQDSSEEAYQFVVS